LAATSEHRDEMVGVTDAANHVMDVYRRHGAAWAVARGTDMPERAWIDRFANLLDPAATVLDIGCGSGMPIARYLADEGHALTGVDSSPGMIALFRSRVPGSSAEVADMRSLDLGVRFGGLIAWDSFFHLTPAAQRLMFPIFRDHTEPGAALLLTSGPAAGEAIGTLEGEPLYHASLDPDEYRRLLGRAGFDVVAHVAEDPDCGARTVWLACRR
jgi:SAM-dependent methyltransferase